MTFQLEKIERSFNSILVRLKDNFGFQLRSVLQGFNSILVRLKGFKQIPAMVGGVEFQFHTGSIKRGGDIFVPNTGDDGFNSILVRLKVLRKPNAKRSTTVSIPYWFD